MRRITNGGRKVIGKFPSIKCGRMVWWESQLERDYLYLLEIDPDVVFYKEQPLIVNYWKDGKIRRYTPDLLVTRMDRSKQIIEVKNEERAQSPEYLELFRMVDPICSRDGYEFVVVTDRHIRVQPRLNNIKFIYKYAKTKITTAHQILLYEIFKQKEVLTLEQVIKGFASYKMRASTVYALIYRGILSADLNQPINPGSAVRLSPAFPGIRSDAA